MQRDDFDANTKDTLAKRVNMRCSNPDCGRGTSGPREDPSKAVNVGVAAHITAAAPGGPRYDVTIDPVERQSIGNGIWLCQVCAKLVDNDVLRYPTGKLRDWKQKAEQRAREEILNVRTSRDLRVRVAPTRQERRQLAQFRLFNASPEPIYITAWSVACGEAERSQMMVSAECLGGSLPKRIVEHDAYNFIVPLDGIAIETITHLGVVGALGESWFADDREVQAFVKTAVAYRLPEAQPLGPGDSALMSCQVEIEAQKAPAGASGTTLAIVFRNHGPHPIPLRGAELKWRYDPPRGLSPSGGPQVMETDGSVQIGAGLPPPVVLPGHEHRFVLNAEFINAVVSVLSNDVDEKSIAATVLAGQRLRWEETEGVGSVVREVAQAIVSTWR